MIKKMLCCGLLLINLSLWAQDDISWQKHEKLAEEMFERAQYADAAEHFKQAWAQKSKNLDLIYRAGEAFYLIKDYQNAAEAFQHVKEMNDKYPLVGLKYARSLKQSGEFDAASREFVYFLNIYEGENKEDISTIVQNEIRGCELGIKLLADGRDPNARVENLGVSVNSPETDFAPIPFSDEVLYFSSTRSGRAEIYRSQKKSGEWTQAMKPENFPAVEGDHYCNGSLTPDLKRFYFTICKNVESWGGLSTRCEIYVTQRTGKAWGMPERLRDYVNMNGVTSTHPYVVHTDDKEILYFSSNRPGGYGGMDLWYMTRDLSTDDIDFTYPINLGEKVNTAGDEITPYYAQEEGVLYYASNGHVSLGGYDVFVVNGEKSEWQEVQNLNTPVNSEADDYFFIKSPSGKTAFFVSNRLFGMEKITTTHEDVFSFNLSNGQEVTVQGDIYDKNTQEAITNVSMSLFRTSETGGETIFEDRFFSSGNFNLPLEANSNYILEAKKVGYANASIEINTFGSEMNPLVSRAIYLEPLEISADDLPLADNTSPASSTSTDSYASGGNGIQSNGDKEEPAPVPYSLQDEMAKTESTTTETSTPTVSDPYAANKIIPEDENSVTESTIVERNPSTSTTSEDGNSYTPTSSSTTTTGENSGYTPSSSNTITEAGNYNPTTATATIPAKEEIITTTTTTTVTRRIVPSTESIGTTYSSDGETYTYRPYAGGEELEIRSNAPRHEGTYYKVQLIAVYNFDIGHRRYQPVKDYARFDTEYITERNLVRVLLADFWTLEEAREMREKVRQESDFGRAFIIKYRDGERIGRVK